MSFLVGLIQRPDLEWQLKIDIIAAITSPGGKFVRRIPVHVNFLIIVGPIVVCGRPRPVVRVFFAKGVVIAQVSGAAGGQTIPRPGSCRLAVNRPLGGSGLPAIIICAMADQGLSGLSQI
jgi:hypothetical protein